MAEKARKSPLFVREELSSPVEFGRYWLTERIGEGGMAQVFRATTAWAEGVAKEVCVKRILSPLAQDARTREMFVQEARIAASLTHANIVPVYEFGTVDEYYFLAMEYVEGFTLREIMMQSARKKRWPTVALTLHLVSEVLEGLDYAHRKRDADGQLLGIVHRDVTPGNVMASVEGEVKILDFGIAAMARNEQEKSDATSGSLAKFGRGKPGYVSPEQAVGMAVDHRSDIFSVGVLLYEMLSHRRLFPEKTIEERLRRDDAIAPPSAYNRDVDADLDAVVMTALNPKPADGQRSAAAFRDALHDYMYEKNLRAGRSHVAAEVAALFDMTPVTALALGRELGLHAGAFDPDSAQARPPKQREVQRSGRRISTTVGQVTLHSTMRKARRNRRKDYIVAALVVATIAVAGIALGSAIGLI